MTQADFFMRFAKRGRDDIVIVGFDPAAGKTYLTRMMAQAVGAAGQQHLQAGIAAEHATAASPAATSSVPSLDAPSASTSSCAPG